MKQFVFQFKQPVGQVDFVVLRVYDAPVLGIERELGPVGVSRNLGQLGELVDQLSVNENVFQKLNRLKVFKRRLFPSLNGVKDSQRLCVVDLVVGKADKVG